MVITALDGMHNTLRILFTTLLPIIAFSIHHLMLKRSEIFTHALVANLYNERDKFNNLSMIDPLTGLYNRRGLENKITMLLEPQTGHHYVLLLDIDHFKVYNDSYGRHAIGRWCRWRSPSAMRCVRATSWCATAGKSFGTADQRARRLRGAAGRAGAPTGGGTEHPHGASPQHSGTLTLSAGISALEKLDVESAIGAADAALYLAKHSGRNNIQLAQNVQPALLQPQE